MKRITFSLALLVLISLNLYANSSDKKRERDILVVQKSEQIESQKTVIEKQQVRSDVNLVLSKTARFQETSSTYVLQILHDQINWDYRSLIRNNNEQQEYKDFLRNGI